MEILIQIELQSKKDFQQEFISPILWEKWVKLNWQSRTIKF